MCRDHTSAVTTINGFTVIVFESNKWLSLR